jgi:hypothetical protein
VTPCVLSTARLDLVPATEERLRAELRSAPALASGVGMGGFEGAPRQGARHGFTSAGTGSEPGVLRFVRERGA